MNEQIKWLIGAALLLGGWVAGFMMGDRVAPSTPAVPIANAASAIPSNASFAAPIRVESPASAPALEASQEELSAAAEAGPLSEALLSALRIPGDLQRLIGKN